ncbi:MULTISPECIES: TetR/AcrR family transcriptional regulator [Gracilibacillus]|uniref:TetR/AcrR family transcriptional regulator n=1 Tax=Gracilibacillus TaxID=74385 RepID=UPI0008264CE2|nr:MULTISPECIES: TetR/AcrR family transcriptional regulator [Gracilibacillus]
MDGFTKRTKEKRTQVLKAAFELMNTDDQKRNVTMEEIAAHAGVAKTTIFKYFGTKEKLFQEVYQHVMHTMKESAKTIMEEDKSFEKTLLAMSQNKIRFLNEMTHAFYLDMMAYLTDKEEGGASPMMQEFAQDGLHMLLDVFHRGRKEGKIDLKYSDEFLILYFQTIVEGMSNRQIYEKIAPYTAEWTEIFIKGLAPNK